MRASLWIPPKGFRTFKVIGLVAMLFFGLFEVEATAAELTRGTLAQNERRFRSTDAKFYLALNSPGKDGFIEVPKFYKGTSFNIFGPRLAIKEKAKINNQKAAQQRQSKAIHEEKRRQPLKTALCMLGGRYSRKSSCWKTSNPKDQPLFDLINSTMSPTKARSLQATQIIQAAGANPSSAAVQSSQVMLGYKRLAGKDELKAWVEQHL